jgi:hypothetical protein
VGVAIRIYILLYFSVIYFFLIKFKEQIFSILSISSSQIQHRHHTVYARQLDAECLPTDLHAPAAHPSKPTAQNFDRGAIVLAFAMA